MGKILPRSASADRIKTATSKALLAARARGGEIQTLAEARIGEVAAALADNDQKLNQARANDAGPTAIGTCTSSTSGSGTFGLIAGH